MENLVINKKADISDLLADFKQLINLHSSEVSEYLKKSVIFEIQKTRLMMKIKMT